jgi:AcrR family transcriptional regulator
MATTPGQMIRKRTADDAEPASGKVRRNREQEVLEAATRIFASKGYAATSVQDLAEAVGVLKGSLYHYMDSKEDLLFTILHQAHAENEQLMRDITALEIGPVGKLRTYLERSLRTTLENVDRTSLYFQDWRRLSGERLEILVEQRRQYDAFLRQLIRAAHESLDIKAELDIKYMSSFVVGATNWVADWYRSTDSRTADEVVRNYTDLAMATIVAGAAPHRLIANAVS